MTRPNRAVRNAEFLAAVLRRCGYPEAHAEPEYCVDEWVGLEYTHAFSVYMGPKGPSLFTQAVQSVAKLFKIKDLKYAN